MRQQKCWSLDSDSSGLRVLPIHEAFRPLIGLPAWNVQRGHGSFLTLEFGSPRLDVREPIAGLRLVENASAERLLRRRRVAPVGEWHLWIYLGYWDVEREGQVVGTSDGPVERIDTAAALIDGQVLQKVDLLAAPLTTAFHFDLGATLRVRPHEAVAEDPDELWSLYEPGGTVLTLRADAHYSHARGDSREHQWLPLPEGT